MFLDLLENKEQEKFLELAYFVANYNDDFAEEQQQLINEYRKEMLLTEDEYQIKGKEEKNIIKDFSKYEEDKKKMIYIETISLLLSDNKFDKKEKEIAEYIKNEFDLSQNFYDKAFNWVKDMFDLYNRVDDLVYGEI
ncbi:MAG: hypothetical protein ACOCV1_05045 [Bacillota bacterium]